MQNMLNFKAELTKEEKTVFIYLLQVYNKQVVKYHNGVGDLWIEKLIELLEDD